MKVFISADIEGTAGITDWTEALKEGSGYHEFRQLMTNELVAACEGARAAGAKEVVVKDAHQTGRNLLVSDLPDYVRIFRGWSGHPHAMMSGLEEGFDAALYTGYHSKAGSGANPLAHTFRRETVLRLNGELASEFTINALCAARLSVPSVFLSGDKGICDDATAMVPGIATLPVSEGFGPATLSISPRRAVAEIRDRVEAALKGGTGGCMPQISETFTLDIQFTTPSGAYKASWYPGAELIGPCEVRFVSDDYFEIMRACCVVLKI